MGKLSPVKVLLTGMPYHASALAEQLERFAGDELEALYSETPTAEQFSAGDVLHLISAPLPDLLKLRKYGKPIIYHWIGSDVLRIIEDPPLKRLFKRILIKAAPARHYAVSEPLCRELHQAGIAAAHLPMVQASLPDEPLPLPEKFAVLCYLPEDRWQFYRGDLTLQIAEALPDIDFHIVAAAREGNNFPNLCFHGFVKDMQPLYARCQVLLRMPLHDGLPKMVLEALSYGRQVLWNYPFPHCRFVRDKESAIKILRELSARPVLNSAGHQFVRENYHPEKLARQYLELYRSILPERR